MKLNRHPAMAGLLLLFALFTSVFSSSDHAHHGNFTYDSRDFLLNGNPYQIIAGQMDPQRIPPQYWRYRLQMARSMGLNTILSYIFWNNIEPVQGQFNFEGRNDIATFFRTAQEEGLHVVLRPGPYVCGEHEWGGFPAWLMEVPGMIVRSNNQPFLEASKSFLDRVGSELESLLVTQGGPILMAQLENEYGFYSNTTDDKAYLAALADLLKGAFNGIPLFTDDGGSVSALEIGSLHGILAETDGSPQDGFAARDNLTDPTLQGPLFCAEYYIDSTDNWASNDTHSSPDQQTIASDVSTLEWVLQGNNSFSIYMFHGGTNFGFESASVTTNVHITTSYDYGAPLDETGRTTAAYLALRQMISKYVPAGSIPDIPNVPPLAQVDGFALQPSLPLFSLAQSARSEKSENPINMEKLGQSYGYILYEHTVTHDADGTLQPGDQPRDRVIIYVNGKKQGVIDNLYAYPPPVNVTLSKGDTLALLVENEGRVDLTTELLDQRKGIVGNVSVGDSILSGWTSYSLPLSELPRLSTTNRRGPDQDTPMFYSGSFKLPPHVAADQSGDLLLNFPDTVKGQVWVNGNNMGRSWIIGPQQDLYIPGCYLHDGGRPNEVILLDLEPQWGKNPRIQSVTTRLWANNPDPDLVQ